MRREIKRLYSPGYYQNTKGRLKELKPLSVIDRIVFFEKYLPALGDELQRLENLRLNNGLEAENFTYYFDNSELVRQLCKKCLSICGVKIKELTIDQVYQFLIESDGKAGWLIQTYQPVSVDDNLLIPEALEAANSSEDKVSTILAALSLMTDDITQAIETMVSLPSETLDQVLKERKALFDNDKKKKEKTTFGLTEEQELELVEDYNKFIGN